MVKHTFADQLSYPITDLIQVKVVVRGLPRLTAQDLDFFSMELDTEMCKRSFCDRDEASSRRKVGVKPYPLQIALKFKGSSVNFASISSFYTISSDRRYIYHDSSPWSRKYTSTGIRRLLSQIGV